MPYRRRQGFAPVSPSAKNTMRHFLLALLLTSAVAMYGQTTAIPDPAFEQALIDLGFDSGELDGVAQNLFLESIIPAGHPRTSALKT